MTNPFFTSKNFYSIKKHRSQPVLKKNVTFLKKSFVLNETTFSLQISCSLYFRKKKDLLNKC